MWRARLGENAGCTNLRTELRAKEQSDVCRVCNVRPAQRSFDGTRGGGGAVCAVCTVQPVEGWTQTPLFKEVERMRGVCAKVALENAAVAALIPSLRADCVQLSHQLEERLAADRASRETELHRSVEEACARVIDARRAPWLEPLEAARNDATQRLCALEAAVENGGRRLDAVTQLHERADEASAAHAHMAARAAAIEERAEQQASHADAEIERLTGRLDELSERVESAVRGLQQHTAVDREGADPKPDPDPKLDPGERPARAHGW